MKLYLDLEEIDSIPEPFKRDSSEIMRITGLNTGNFAFRHALRKIITDIDEYEVVTWRDAHRIINSKLKISHVLVSCANWLGFTDQDERSNKVRANVIRDLNAPITAFGLGAQSPNADLSMSWGPNTEDLARALSEKSTLLSVRDDFTHRMLERIGINNSVVTGCPSNFISDDSCFIEKLRHSALASLKKENEIRKFQIGEFSGGNKYSGAILNKTIDFMSKNASSYVIQSPMLYPFFLNEESELPAPYKSNRPSNLTCQELSRLLKQTLIGFSSMDAWLDHSRSHDLSFGMRIHGNMVPLQSGVPAVLIAHDARTEGLGSVMKIPKINISEFLKIEDEELPEFMLNRFLGSLQEYESTREDLRNIMKNYLKNHNLNHQSSFN